MPLNSVWLAATYNQTLTSADNIESFTPNIGTPRKVRVVGVGSVYCYVSSLSTFSEGQERYDPSGAVSYAGFKTVTYVQERMHRDTLAWLIANYRGQVSVNLTQDSTVYADWNALLKFNKTLIPATEFYSVEWVFTLIEEIP